MRNSKKINRFRWKGSCSTVSSFLYKFKLLRTQRRVHVYVAHYVIFLYVACREIGSLSEQVKQKAKLRDYNIQSRSSLFKKPIWVHFLHVINMCGLLQVTSSNIKRVQSRLQSWVLFNCVTEQITDRTTLNGP